LRGNPYGDYLLAMIRDDLHDVPIWGPSRG